MNNLEKKYLYVGCGRHRLKGFLHADVNVTKTFGKKNDFMNFDFFCDIKSEIPVKDNSLKFIYSRGTLEHLTYRELINHLIICWNKLEINGIVRMVVPDFDSMLDRYLKKKDNVKEVARFSEVDEDLPTDDHYDLLIARLLYHDHYYIHNLHSMKKILNKCGFSNVKKK